MDSGPTMPVFSLQSSKVGSVINHIMEMLDWSLRMRSTRFSAWGRERHHYIFTFLSLWPLLTVVLSNTGVETGILSYLEKEKRNQSSDNTRKECCSGHPASELFLELEGQWFVVGSFCTRRVDVPVSILIWHLKEIISYSEDKFFIMCLLPIYLIMTSWVGILTYSLLYALQYLK